MINFHIVLSVVTGVVIVEAARSAFFIAKAYARRLRFEKMLLGPARRRRARGANIIPYEPDELQKAPEYWATVGMRVVACMDGLLVRGEVVAHGPDSYFPEIKVRWDEDAAPAENVMEFNRQSVFAREPS